MKLPFPDPRIDRPAIPLRVSVFSDHFHGKVAAFLHEKGTEGTYFAKVEFSIAPEGLVEEYLEKSVIQRKVFHPAGHELKEVLQQRIRKFAQRYGVSPENIYYETWDGQGQMLRDCFEPPRGWTDSKFLQFLRKKYELKIQREKKVHAASLCEQGWKLFGFGRVRAAFRQFRDAGQLAPDFYLPWIGLAEVLICEDKIGEAKQQLQRAAGLLEKSRRLTPKARLRESKRLEEVFRRLEQKQLEAQKSRLTPSPSASIPGNTPLEIPVKVSFSIAQLPQGILEKYRQKEFEPLSFYQLRLQVERLRFFEGFDDLLAPLHARIDFYEHQNRTARIVLRRMRGRALLCDEVGLGKTVEAGLVLKEYLLRGMISKVLILAAPSLVSQWRHEMFEKFGIDFLTSEEIGRFSESRDFWAGPLIVASLALAKREPHQSAILNQDYDLVIVDEAHHLRNRQTLAWKFVNQLKKKYLLLLTATPIHNDLEELYNLITLLRPGQLGTPVQFKNDFAEHGNLGKPKNMEKLRSLLREVMIRNTRASAAVKLPRRIARTISVDFTHTERDIYQRISGLVRDLALERQRGSRFLLTVLQREAGSSLRAVLPTLQKLKRGLSGSLCSKIEETLESIQSIQEASKLSALQAILKHLPDKCLIFTEFLETQAYLAESLTKIGLSAGIFNGSLTAQEKDSILREFEEKGRVLILTPSGGEGTNLQFCRTLVNYDLPWNPMKIEQRIGRIHRIGQTGEVLIYNLAAKQTVEHYLLKILDEKLNLFELVVGEAETILGELTEEKDFEEILMDIWLEASNCGELESKIDAFGNRILEEKAKYFEAKRLDGTLFKQDYETV